MKKIIIAFVLISQFVSAQSKGTVKGMLTDGESNNDPLPFANVFIKGTTHGGTSDFDGNYSLSVPAGKHILVFSFVSNSRDGMAVTPILGVLVAIACGLALVAVAIIIVLRLRPSNYQRRRQKPGGSAGDLNGTVANGMYLNGGVPSTHIPLRQRMMDDPKEPDLIPSTRGAFLPVTILPVIIGSVLSISPLDDGAGSITKLLSLGASDVELKVL